MRKVKGHTARVIRRLHWPIVIIVVGILIFTFSGSPFEPISRIAEALAEPTVTHTIERMCE